MPVKPITVFRASTGLNVKVDPVRIPFDPATGIADLAVAYNVDHDHTGRLSRRKGYTRVNTTAFTSLFYGGTDVVGVTGSSLCVLPRDLTTYRAVGTVTAGAKLSCVQVADAVFWVNGHEKGYIRSGVNHAWVMGDYYGPDTKRVFVGPPIGELIESLNAQIYIADGPTLYVSDAFSLNHFDAVRGEIPWETQITMLRAVAGGLFVGSAQGCWFMPVSSPTDFRLEKINRCSSVIKGTDVKCDLGKTSFGRSQLMTGIGVMWAAKDGIYLGTPDGKAFNLTDQKLYPLEALSGSAHIANGRYILNLNG